MNSKKFRVRFAPSPTGHLHIGNARTALFNYLFARHSEAVNILRIEDTDLQRSTIESENLIYEDLKWLGIEWDEGPDKGGSYGPYRQSERLPIYKEAVSKLINENKAYPCFCTIKDLETIREKSKIEGKPQIYDGRCRNLSANEVEEKKNKGLPFSIRFKVDRQSVFVNDLIHGEIEFRTDAFGDFIIVRPDGMPIYNFVVVIDDALMEVSHVIRGDDHLSNTPKQVLIFDALGFKKPLFVHIPMILGPDRTKLSKRHGVTSIATFREKGYLPEALFNYLALLGWAPAEGEEILSKEEIIPSFDLFKISKSAAIFDFAKLNWLNGLYIRKMDLQKLTDKCVPYLIEMGYVNELYVNKHYGELKKIVESVRDNLEVIEDIVKYTKVFFAFDDGIDAESLSFISDETSVKIMNTLLNKLEAFEKDSFIQDDYQKLIDAVKSDVNVKGKKLFMTIRIALTGKMQGPELKDLFAILTLFEMKRRINFILNKVTLNN
jgi:glutamyl-tRNA synthetase